MFTETQTVTKRNISRKKFGKNAIATRSATKNSINASIEEVGFVSSPRVMSNCQYR